MKNECEVPPGATDMGNKEAVDRHKLDLGIRDMDVMKQYGEARPYVRARMLANSIHQQVLDRLKYVGKILGFINGTPPSLSLDRR